MPVDIDDDSKMLVDVGDEKRDRGTLSPRMQGHTYTP
jgi:hypothetical protein